jgi:hypothetical protein
MYKIILLILLILVLIYCYKSNIESFKDSNTIDVVDADQNNKLNDLTKYNDNLNQEINTNIDNKITDLNIKIRSTEVEYEKDKKKDDEILKQCEASVNPTVGYDKIPKKSCENRHILGESSTSIGRCAENCKKNKDCLSFSYDNKKGNCRLSASCYNLNSKTDENYDTYVKQNIKLDDYPLTKFNMYLNKKCKFPTDMVKPIKNISVIDCAKKCNEDDKCISYHLKKGTGYNGDCYLSQKCYMGGCTADDKSYNLFTKYHFNSKQAQYRQCEKCPVPHYTFSDINASSKNKMVKLSGTNYCMDMTGKTGNHKNIYIWQCNQNNRNQRFWYYEPQKSIRAINGGYCFDIDGSPRRGRNIQQYRCLNNNNQRWYYDSRTKQIKSPFNNICMDNSRNRHRNGNNIWGWNCSGSPAQRWEIGVFDSNGKQI